MKGIWGTGTARHAAVKMKEADVLFRVSRVFCMCILKRGDKQVEGKEDEDVEKNKGKRRWCRHSLIKRSVRFLTPLYISFFLFATNRWFEVTARTDKTNRVLSKSESRSNPSKLDTRDEDESLVQKRNIFYIKMTENFNSNRIFLAKRRYKIVNL